MTRFPEDPGRALLAAELREDRLNAGAAEHVFSEPTLQRFLDGNNGSVPDAAKHFRKMLQWRIDNNVDAEIKSLVTGKPWAVESVPGLQRLLSLMRVGLGGYTHEGHMIWVQCDGRAQLDEIMAMPEEELLRTMLMMCELRKEHLDGHSMSNGRLMKILQVRDLSGLSIMKVIQDATLLNRFRRLLGVVTTAYPETLHKIVMVNIPRSFDLLWTVLKPLFNERMQEKMLFLRDTKNLAEDLAALGGAGALEALARARADVNEETASIDLPAGKVAYACFRVKAGEVAEWSFEVSPATSQIEISVLFCPHGPSPSLSDVVKRSIASETMSGTFEALQDGLLWLTFSSAQSWTAAEVLNLRWQTNKRASGRLLTSSSSSARPSLSSKGFVTKRKQALLRCHLSGCFEFSKKSFSWKTRRKDAASQQQSEGSPPYFAGSCDNSFTNGMSRPSPKGILPATKRSSSSSPFRHDVCGMAMVSLLIALLLYFAPVIQCREVGTM